MNKHLLTLVITFCCCTVSFSQKMYFPQEKNADCTGAIVMTDSMFGPTVPPEGHGQSLEIQKNQMKDMFLFEREHNTLWYTFEAIYSTELSLDIIAMDSIDDFDFLLFKHDGSEDFCDKIRRREIRPARTNMAKNRADHRGVTGLAREAEREYVQSGPGDPFSKSIYVQKGEKFYLVVDNYSKEGKGHKLHMHYAGYPKPKVTLKFSAVDKTSRKPVVADVEVLIISDDKNQKDEVLHSLSDSAKYKIKLEAGTSYEINCNAKGYFFFSRHLNGNKVKNSLKMVAKLTKVVVGEKLTLQNINFKENSSKLLNSSMASLDNLVSFMHHNKTVTIEVQGHVNAPNMKNSKEVKEVSESRAKSVYLYLIKNNVKAARLVFKGYGNKEMIHPQPANEIQELANRRVDILITGL
ncbi:MAG: hypothetical protein COB85_02105 [Bacteroidetes bacterium]|nr:MAG: hypothetical protein COB85_02105 [Bacteroidota bacterium]